jgi:U32 family peptidase
MDTRPPTANPAAPRPPRPELLAPAGDRDCLRAAVANGADAVYFGLESFNARQRAANFKVAELPEIVAYLHGRNVKAYVTFNTLIFSDELPQAIEYAASIARAGADAVIVQDLGLASLIRRLAPTIQIHASTQTTQTEPIGIEFLRSLGVSRVILARELTLSEIEQIRQRTAMPLEVFVHGAICISFSGQCLASESLWGRSANRGLCGQACRLPYQIVIDGRPQDAGDRQYILSAQDLSALPRLPDLIKLGIAGFKIEGRLKSARYVAAAAGAYRASIDTILGLSPASDSPDQESSLALSFSRGLCRGFLDGVDHQKLVHGRFPKSRGIYVGTVVAKTRRGVVVQLSGDGRPPASPHTTPRGDRKHRQPAPTSSSAASFIKPGDGLVFDEGHPEQDEQGGRVFSVEPANREAAPAGGAASVELTFGRGDVNLAAISIGSKVWKTDDPAIRRRLERSYRGDRSTHRVPLHARVSACLGKPLAIALRDDAGREVQVTWDQPLHEAVKHPLTVELLQQQLDRLGDTPFELASIELLGPSGPTESQPVMVPKSVLNDLRRQAVQLLLDGRAASSHHEIRDIHVLDSIRDEIRQHFHEESARDDKNRVPIPEPQLHVLARTFPQFEAVLEWTPPLPAAQPPMLYCDFPDARDWAKAVALGRNAGWSVGLATPRVLMPAEEHLLKSIACAAPKAILVRNLGSLEFFRRHCPAVTLIGDFSLNVANEVTAFLLAKSGLARLTASYDLNWRQLNAMSHRFPAALLEVVLHQHVPMFHTRHCLFAAHLTQGTRCEDCGRPCAQHELHLRDRNGADHPLLADAAGRNTVFNAAVQTAAELLPAMQQVGLRHFRVELLRESPAQARDLLDHYARLFAG